jgi:hypothetical protein
MSELGRLITRGREIYGNEGPLSVVSQGLDKISVLFAAPFYRAARGHRTFTVGTRELQYFTHPYNATWRNERAVEVPLALEFLKAKSGARSVLEIGNVMHYYDQFPHTVLDKYEKSPGVINQDIMEFVPKEPFDTILSLSTFEHIGWDEKPKDPPKVGQAIKRLRTMLSSGGSAMVTMPTGYNEFLDAMFARGAEDFDDHFFLKRVSADNRWLQVPWTDIKNCRYDGKYPAANSLFVGFLGCRSPFN